MSITTAVLGMVLTFGLGVSVASAVAYENDKDVPIAEFLVGVVVLLFSGGALFARCVL